MAPAKTPITETELEVLKALWERGASTARELRDDLGRTRRRWAQTTLLTLLGRLEEKGCVHTDRSRIPHVFRAALTREDLAQRRFQTLTKDLFDGASLPVLVALVKGGSLSAADLQEFRDLLDELDGDADPEEDPT